MSIVGQLIGIKNTLNNPTIVFDFRSDDKIERFPARELSAYSGKGPTPRFPYVPKGGGEVRGKGWSYLKPEELARVRYAFIHEPCVHSWGELLQSAARFDEIVNPHISDALDLLSG